MALYKNRSEVTHNESTDFDQTYKPGETTPFSGIYICVNCRDEIASNKNNPLPPQNHRQHTRTDRPIVWQLLVKTQTGPS